MYTISSGCRACGNPACVEILAFGEMPLANALLSEPMLKKPEMLVPLTVLFCPACSLVQIRETVDPDFCFRRTTRSSPPCPTNGFATAGRSHSS